MVSHPSTKEQQQAWSRLLEAAGLDAENVKRPPHPAGIGEALARRVIVALAAQVELLEGEVKGLHQEVEALREDLAARDEVAVVQMRAMAGTQ